ETSSAAVAAMNSRRFIRSSLQLEETDAEYQFSTVVALGEVQCCVAKRRDVACPQWVNRITLTARRELLLFPDQRTSPIRCVRSESANSGHSGTLGLKAKGK
ncbi:hypothetical protein, partial [Bradyrhizobium sp. AUGA SZCCT0431]|uniref:hypothetical protein n=1 Tax=Bradyrhizobium sp. AUGA SZCCT0431 TaxID=2807674 RepID=UPI001BA62210